MMNTQQYLSRFMQNQSIAEHYRDVLSQLGNYEIVVIADDSGSMLDSMGKTGFSRWDFARRQCETICKVAQVFDKGGFDLKFLNRSDVDKVTDYTKVEGLFDRLPEGSTPLMRQLEDVVRPYASSERAERKTLIYVITDGEPSDRVEGVYVGKRMKIGQETVEDRVSSLFRKYFDAKEVRENVAISFVMATTEPGVTEYYTRIVDEAKDVEGNPLQVDIVLPYSMARKQVEESNADIEYTEGMHLVKTLTGAFCPMIDNMDTHRVATIQRESEVVVDLDPSQAGCCTIS